MLSIAVSIPTRQLIPTAMISNVSSDLKKLSLIDPKATFTFSNGFKIGVFCS